jgi:hypothetical protein
MVAGAEKPMIRAEADERREMAETRAVVDVKRMVGIVLLFFFFL